MLLRLVLSALFLNSLAAKAAIPPTYSEDLVTQAVQKKLAFDPQWLRLVHYKKGFWGDWKSQADGMKFFLSNLGKTDPEAELIATIHGLFSDVGRAPDQEAPQCQFPARYLWLKEKLHIDPLQLKSIPCPRFLDFRESVSAKSLSLIFSSYYLNNPASAFGHTLLRLNKAPLGQQGKQSFELLDNGFNYAAVIDTSSAVIYAFKGVFGMFRGTFTRMPYYYKVREYNDFESRDLWAYDLNLSQAQVDLIVAHIWELGSTYFDYWYLDENCAYHMLTVLEVALPNVNLSDNLPWIVVPAETVKVVAAVPGLVAEVRFRPSIRAQFKKRIELLSPEQISALHGIGSKGSAPRLAENFSPKQKAQIFDAAIDYADLKYFRDLVEEPEGSAAKWKQKLLVARSQIPVTSDELKVDYPKDDVPHIGHGISRVGLDGGAEFKGQSFTGVNYRFALHDLLDPKPGYPETSEIEFFNTRLRYHPQNGHLWLDEFNFFQVISISPMDAFTKQLSWRVKVGAATVRDLSCDHCIAGNFEAGAGFATQFFKSVTGFITMDAVGMASPKLDGAWFRPGAGPTLGVRLQLDNSLIALFTSQYRYRVWTKYNDYWAHSGEVRWSFKKDWSLNLKTAKFPDTWETSVGLFYYF